MNKIVLATMFNNMPIEKFFSLNDSFIDSFINKCPECKLISNFSEIQKILNLKEIKIIEFLYKNRINIHNILYEEEKIIILKPIYLKSFSDFFYTDLLIKDNPKIINYSFSIDVIQNINSFIQDKDLNIKKVIVSKISIDFIQNYKSNNDFNYDDEEELNKIQERNNKEIEINLKCFNDINININYNKNEIFLKTNDEIYTEVIIGLIKYNTFSDYEFIFNIINQLEFESIYITNKMFTGINEILKEDFVKIHIISKVEDLINIKKINFYFFLFNILKDSFYLYQIPILLKTKKFIIKNIRNYLIQLQTFDLNKESIIKKRIDYIIKIITDSQYYYNIYSDSSIIQKLNEIYNYYKNFLYESKIIEIKYLKEFIENKKPQKFNYILIDFEKAKYMNNRLPIIQELFSIDNITTISENKMNKCAYDWKILENMIKQKKYKKIRKNTIKFLLQYFITKENKSILLNIFNVEDLNSFINKFNIDKKVPEEKELINIKSIDNNNNELDIKIQSTGKIKDTSIIRESYYIQTSEVIEDTKSIKQNEKKEKEKEEDNYKVKGNNMNISIFKEVEKEKFQILIKSSKYKVLEFIKIMGKLKRPQDIKKLSNDCFIIGGEDNYLNIYDGFYNFLMKVDLPNYKSPYDLIENTYNKKKMELIVCSQDNLFVFEIDIKQNEFKPSRYEASIFSCISIFQLEENKYIIAGNKGIIYFRDLFSHQKRPVYHCNNYTNPYIGGIRINHSIVAFTSNSIISSDAEDKIVFYEWDINKIFQEIEGYSFVLSINGLCLINSDKIDANKKLLLCACKKYNNEKKNGILVIYVDLDKKYSTFEHYFYETGNFEVFCFCQISNVYNDNPINGDIFKKENIKVVKTDYFLVGGFHDDRREGMLKLFKVSHNIKFSDTKIQYLQDIKIEDNNEFNGFEGPISCISQSDLIGNILITCWDGNIYLFKPTNIDFFLQMDKNS